MGSLSGWNACNDDYIRDLLGHEDEVIDNDGQSALINHDEKTNLTKPTSNTLDLPTTSSVCVKPLAKKQVTNILTAVCGTYSSFSEEQ